MQNHYFNPNHPLKPYTYNLLATPGTLPPSNAIRDNEPQIVQGTWPCWNGTEWEQVEDHRKREVLPDMITWYGVEYPQDGTEYWLPGDTHETPARMMKEVGPLPEGALLERPAKAFDVAYADKMQEIINGADAVKATLSRKYSTLEEQTWPQQEAGARAILGLEADCKDETARAILKDAEGRTMAISLVEKLAEAGNTTREEFAQRIVTNADKAYSAGIQTLLEQQGYETALKAVLASRSVEAIEAIVVEYSVLKTA